jgi:hypothetical protein
MSQRLFITSTFRRTAYINHEQQSGSRVMVCNRATVLNRDTVTILPSRHWHAPAILQPLPWQ